MADHMRSDLVADALQMAVARREPEAGLIHHGALTALAVEQTQMAPPAWASRAPRRIVSAVEAAPPGSLVIVCMAAPRADSLRPSAYFG
jgi:transposase InsO family protein